MASITIEIPDDRLQQLKDLATAQGINLEILLQTSLADWLDAQNEDFLDAAEYVLTKNAELYERLA
ncbi:DNA-binding protein [Geitlerinema sp. CS-897]|nr:DNA-binding protein [Geitlerinema sp. CS-897]